MVLMRYARPLIAGSAAALAAILGATAAFAAATWTIKPGGTISSTTTNVHFKDTTTGSIFTCSSVAFSGTLKSGSGLSGSGAGSISAVTFTTCTSPLRHRRVAVTFLITPKDLPWHVNFTAYSSGVAMGSISHMQIMLGGPSCQSMISGTSATANDGHVRFRYANGTGRLTILTTGGNLHFYNVTGCAGLFHSNDPLTISGTFPLSPKQAITSP
jgi:hypothetical protein